MIPEIARKYFELKGKKLPEKEVSEEEFIRLMIESGKTPTEAKMHAALAKGLGSHCEINGFFVSIKE